MSPRRNARAVAPRPVRRAASGKTRALGQHFLRDDAVAERIVALVQPTSRDLVIEIGPGEGALTGRLARASGRLLALEVDHALAAALRERFAAASHVEIRDADARSFDYASLPGLKPEAGGRVLAVANLPYSVAKPILQALVEAGPAVDEMAIMLDMAREFGFHIAAFHHAVEAYKVRDLLAAAGTGAAVWADWWGFKEEAMDGIKENAALLQEAGVRLNIHSDSPSGIQRLNQEAAKAMYAGSRAGIPVTRDQALRWITANPAWALGLDSIIGSLEPGKMADVVVWSGDPFSVYAKAVQVYNDGWLVYDRGDATHQPRTDFELGQVPPPGSDR